MSQTRGGSLASDSVSILLTHGIDEWVSRVVHACLDGEVQGVSTGGLGALVLLVDVSGQAFGHPVVVLI